MTDICDKIKSIGRMNIGPTAKYVGTVMATCGLKTAREVVNATGLSRATVYRAMAEYAEACIHDGDETHATEDCLTCLTSENLTSLTDGNCSEKPVSTVSSVRLSDPEPSRACALMESLRDSSSQVVSEEPHPLKGVPPKFELVAVAQPTSSNDALEAFRAYNELAQRIGLPMARSLTPGRKRSIDARLRENGGLEGWAIALANVERSAFLRGNNQRRWRADLDFLLQARSLPRVIDGGYGNGAHGEQAMETRAQRIMRLCEEAGERMGLPA